MALAAHLFQLRVANRRETRRSQVEPEPVLGGGLEIMRKSGVKIRIRSRPGI